MTNDKKPKNRFGRELFSEDGKQIDRFEFSFYGDKLKRIEFYKRIIRSYFPGKSKHLSQYKIYRDVSVDHYWKTLYEG